MSATGKYRAQHEELLELASKISARLDVEAISLDPGRVKNMISQLMGKLSYHLAMEDELLYPGLLDHPDESVSALARKYVC
jgi:iron-sulfur cluster repair protein YtfE (RIC family)